MHSPTEFWCVNLKGEKRLKDLGINIIVTILKWTLIPKFAML
jgi:hypothetical protein